MDQDDLNGQITIERLRRTALHGAWAFLACAIASLVVPALFGQQPFWAVGAFFIAFALLCLGLRWAVREMHGKGLW